MSAWGVILKPGNKAGVPFVPPPEGGRLHVSQATLVGGDASTDVTIFYRPGGVDEDEQGGADGTPKRRAPPPPLALTRLRGGGKAEAAALDLIFDHYAEFMVVAGGKAGGVPAEVHLTGYELPDADVSDEEDEDEGMLDSDEEEEAGLQGAVTPAAFARAVGRAAAGAGGGPAGGSSSEEDDDEDGDSESDDEDDDGSDLDDDDEDDDDEEGRPAARARPDVLIEELDGSSGGEEEAGAKKTTGKAAQKAAAPAAPSDEDGEESDSGSGSEEEEEPDASDDDSGSLASSSGDDEGEGEESSDEDDDEPDDAPVAPAPAWGKGKAPPAGVPVAGEPSSKKRAAPAIFAPAPPPAKKAAPAPVTKAAAPALKAQPAAAPAAGAVRRYENGFVVETLARGRPGGPTAAAGKRVEVRYIGRLAKGGAVFDQTKGRATFKFRLGVGEVIKGWDAGVAGMKVGEKRRLTIPPQMGYGPGGARPAIPGNATLDFQVELVGVQ